MEYIVVRSPGHAGEDVLVNRLKNGKVGDVIVLGRSGHITVSIGVPNSEEKLVDVRNTTAVHPMAIDIECR